jgi:ABC-type dipeptide/oligopeptide/nickel transport system permease subunit
MSILNPAGRLRALPSRTRPRLRAARALTRSPAAWLATALGAAVLACIVAGLLRSAQPNAVAILSADQAPGWAHPFGTDNYGRDELARFAAGGLTSLLAAACVLGISMGAALVVGTISGLAGGVTDAILMRVNDVLLSIPSLVLAMAVIGTLGPGFSHLVGALSVGYFAAFTRMARTFALACRDRADLTAARLAGVSWWRSVWGHVLPAVTSQLLVISTLTLGDIVISIAALSFLGLGVQPPAAEWGAMLSDARSAFIVAPWLLIAPGLGIVCTALSVNLFADALREAGPS